MNHKYPIFIPSKGRWDSCLTMKAFDEIGIDYTVFVEPEEYDNYAAVLGGDKLYALPHSNKGLVVTRNFIWDYAQNELNTPYFWTFDDNTRKFWRLNRNRKLKIKTGGFLRSIEDFTERYKNVAISGMNYFMFMWQKNKYDPIRINTRVYSNMLIKTDIPYRNRGFYNDDTDLCLQILNDGWCTILFLTFLIEKSVTMTVKGGMTPHYQDDGRYKMALELQQRWPEIVKITRKWGRWQHHVDYRPFRGNKLIKRDDIEIPEGVNNYGMKLVKVDEETAVTA